MDRETCQQRACRRVFAADAERLRSSDCARESEGGGKQTPAHCGRCCGCFQARLGGVFCGDPRELPEKEEGDACRGAPWRQGTDDQNAPDRTPTPPNSLSPLLAPCSCRSSPRPWAPCSPQRQLQKWLRNGGCGLGVGHTQRGRERAMIRVRIFSSCCFLCTSPPSHPSSLRPFKPPLTHGLALLDHCVLHIDVRGHAALLIGSRGAALVLLACGLFAPSHA